MFTLCLCRLCLCVLACAVTRHTFSTLGTLAIALKEVESGFVTSGNANRNASGHTLVLRVRHAAQARDTRARFPCGGAASTLGEAAGRRGRKGRAFAALLRPGGGGLLLACGWYCEFIPHDPNRNGKKVVGLGRTPSIERVEKGPAGPYERASKKDGTCSFGLHEEEYETSCV